LAMRADTGELTIGAPLECLGIDIAQLGSFERKRPQDAPALSRI